MLMCGIEIPHSAGNPLERRLTRTRSMLVQGVDQCALAELFPRVFVRFRHAIGIKREHISWIQLALADGAVPILKKSQQSSRRRKPLAGFVRAQDQSG